MNKAYDRLKKAFEDNPVQVLFAAGIVAQGVAKLMHANTERQNAKTYRMETIRRTMLKNR